MKNMLVPVPNLISGFSTEINIGVVELIACKTTVSLYVILFNRLLNQKYNLHCICIITPKHVTSGWVHLCNLAPG